VSLVIVEQYVDKVLALADHAYIVVRGRIAWHGESKDVDEELLAASYLGREA
jgi:branched-chain amino acid transport system ATP-binding protein